MKTQLVPTVMLESIRVYEARPGLQGLLHPPGGRGGGRGVWDKG